MIDVCDCGDMHMAMFLVEGGRRWKEPFSWSLLFMHHCLAQYFSSDPHPKSMLMYGTAALPYHDCIRTDHSHFAPHVLMIPAKMEK
jgi:hypothetical protein